MDVAAVQANGEWQVGPRQFLPLGLAALVLSLLLPHEFIRLAAVPVGIALALLGYALWSERREKVSEPVPATEPALLSPTAFA